MYPFAMLLHDFDRSVRRHPEDDSQAVLLGEGYALEKLAAFRFGDAGLRVVSSQGIIQSGTAGMNNGRSNRRSFGDACLIIQRQKDFDHAFFHPGGRLDVYKFSIRREIGQYRLFGK